MHFIHCCRSQIHDSTDHQHMTWMQPCMLMGNFYEVEMTHSIEMHSALRAPASCTVVPQAVGQSGGCLHFRAGQRA